jgi:EmrB/QacA subfamily drug resistance transporter
VAFTVTSGLCGLAWSADSLIAFRVLQGVSGGLLAPMAQMVLVRAAGRHFARVVGYAAVPVLIAPLLGPVFAGAILKFASWRWLFLVNVPVGVIAVIMAAAFLSGEREDVKQRDLDWLGLALLSPGLALLLYGADHFGERMALYLLAGAIVLLGAFLWTARRKGDRALIDLALFRDKVFATSSVTTFLGQGVLFAGQMLIPVYLIGACGRSPGEMGLLMAPQGLGMIITYPAMGALTKRFGIRGISVTGALLALASTVPLFFLAARGLDLPVLVAALFFRGVGQSGLGIPAITAAYAHIAPRDLPMATTSLNIVQRLGGPVMTTLCATVLGWLVESGSLHGGSALNPYALTFLLLCFLHLLVLVVALRLPLR